MEEAPLKKESLSKRVNIFLESHRAIIEFIGLCVAIWVLLTYLHANDLTQQSLELSQDQLRLAQDNLKEAQKINEVMMKSIIASNTPWIDVQITSVDYNRAQDRKGNITSNSVIIKYTLVNHSNAPAPYSSAVCFLQNETGYIDPATASSITFAIMPNQTVSLEADLIMEKDNAKDVSDKIKSGQIGISIFVEYNDAINRHTSFIEDFSAYHGEFAGGNTEYNPPESKYNQMVQEAIWPDKNKTTPSP